MATINVDNLRARTILGLNDDERINKQDILINYSMDLDISKAAETDDVQYTVDYKTINKRVLAYVEDSTFLLVETLVTELLKLLLEDERVAAAWVRVDKPAALRFADSVSVEDSLTRA